VNPEAYLVGEIWNPAAEWLAGDRFHAVMNYPLTEAILSFAGAGRLDEALVGKTHEYSRNVRAIDGPEFGRQLGRIMTTYDPAVTQMQLNLLDSHDTPRFLSLAGGDRSALRLAMLVQMTLPGAPCIYYGDEIGLEGREDPDCRRSYPWDPALQDGELRAFVAGLIQMRKTEPALRHGRFRLLAAEAPPSLTPSISTVRWQARLLVRPRVRVEVRRQFRLPVRPKARLPVSTEGSAAGSAVHSIVVVLNAGDRPIRFGFRIPGLAGIHRGAGKLARVRVEGGPRPKDAPWGDSRGRSTGSRGSGGQSRQDPLGGFMPTCRSRFPRRS